MEIRGAAKDAREYPLWDSVDSTSLPGSGGGNGNVTPPFWIAEVEELPRGSAVEWAAGMGVVGGDVKVFTVPFLISFVLLCSLCSLCLIQ